VRLPRKRAPVVALFSFLQLHLVHVVACVLRCAWSSRIRVYCRLPNVCARRQRPPSTPLGARMAGAEQLEGGGERRSWWRGQRRHRPPADRARGELIADWVAPCAQPPSPAPPPLGPEVATAHRHLALGKWARYRAAHHCAGIRSLSLTGYGYGYGQMSDPQGMPLTDNAPWGTPGHAANRHCPLGPAPAPVNTLLLIAAHLGEYISTSAVEPKTCP
jgi:hypothetical protein